MATITINVMTTAGFGDANSDLFAFLGNIDSTSARTGTSFTGIDSTDNVQIRFSGSGFTYSTDGQPQTGSITGIGLIYHGTTIFNASVSPGLSAPSLASASSDQSALDALFSPYSFTFNGGSGPDHFYGSVHADTINGGGGNDTLGGGLGIDHLNGGTGVNTLDYQDAVAAVTVNLLAHTASGGEAAGDIFSNFQNINGGQGNDKLTGDNGPNVLNGGAGSDTLSGLAGNDTQGGGFGNDKLLGGLGNDKLIGGVGNDAFVFNTTLNATTNRDTITDYNVAADTIQLDNAVFTKLVGANNTTLSAAQFFKGAAAHDANDHIIYNSATGALIYDSNGNAAGGAVQFATLAHGLALTNADFFII